MVDIPLAPPTPSSSTMAASASAPGQTVVQVAVTNVPAALENLARSIQTNATPVLVSNANSLTLATALGSITVSLAQQLSGAEKQNLLQQLMAFVQVQRPLTLTLQPGSPPTQGVLLLPTAATNAVAPVPERALPSAQPLPSAPLAIGNDFRAIVLPPSPAPTAILAAAPPPTAITALAIPRTSSPAMETNFLILAAQLADEAQENVTAAPQATGPSTAQTAVPFQQAGVLTTLQEAPSSAAPVPSPQTIITGPPLVDNPAKTIPASPQIAPATSMTPAPQDVQTPQFSPQVASLLTPGNEVSLRVVSILSPNAEQPPALAANQIVATVTGTGTNGQLILQSGDATLFVKAQIPATIGTSVIVSVEPVKSAPLMTLPAAEQPGFQALPQALAALEQLSPRVFQNVMMNFLPQPTDALSGALMFLLSAFRKGDVRGWLGGDAVDTLASYGKSSIVGSLSKELSGAGQTAQDAVVGEWRSYPIPLYAHQQFQALTLYVHSDRDARKDKNAASGTGRIRFLIDMRLSKLGAMQVDGFVQPKKLDMILRSENVLPEGLHHELRGAYIKALDAVGYTGTLGFQVGRQHWMVMNRAALKGIVT
jgi:hypothetical protein